jgi:hypothetical protein
MIKMAKQYCSKAARKMAEQQKGKYLETARSSRAVQIHIMVPLAANRGNHHEAAKPSIKEEASWLPSGRVSLRHREI